MDLVHSLALTVAGTLIEGTPEVLRAISIVVGVMSSLGGGIVGAFSSALVQNATPRQAVAVGAALLAGVAAGLVIGTVLGGAMPHLSAARGAAAGMLGGAIGGLLGGTLSLLGGRPARYQ